MLKDNVTPVKICSYVEGLAWANSQAGQKYLVARNKNIKNLFPLSENFLKNFFANNNFGNFKKSFPDINCANDTIGFLTATYGYTPGELNTGGASQAQSSGLNPFFGFKLNAGFDFGSFGSYLWLALLLAGAYVVSKK